MHSEARLNALTARVEVLEQVIKDFFDGHLGVELMKTPDMRVLSPRERKLLALLRGGHYSGDALGKALNVTSRTARHYVDQVRTKLDTIQSRIRIITGPEGYHAIETRAEVPREKA